MASSMCEGCVLFFSLSPAHPLKSVATLLFQALLGVKLGVIFKNLACAALCTPWSLLCWAGAPLPICAVGCNSLPAYLLACLLSGVAAAFSSSLHALPGPGGAVTVPQGEVWGWRFASPRLCP